MGIDVTNNKEVSFNSNHQDLLDTSTTRNPSIKRLQGLMIHSVFRRKRHKSHSQDGNPLIHALKGNHSYSIERQEIIQFLPSFYEIVDKALHGTIYDLILPLPSSHPINEYLARRIARKCPTSKVRYDYFEKKTVAEIIEELETMDIQHERLKREVKHLLNRLNKIPSGKYFSMKEVSDHKVRKIIHPMKLIADIDIETDNILLVDDLLASGSTLLSANNLLKNKDINVTAICLFSGL